MELFMMTLVSVTIAEMMFAMGLRLSFSRLAESVGRDPLLVARVFALNYLFIPVITLLALRFSGIPAMAGVGLLILAVAPAAPYGPPFTAIAKGNLSLSTGLMVLLAGTSAFMAPLLLHIGLPLVGQEDLSIRIDPARLAGTLFVIQLLPLCAGLALGQWRPRLASVLSAPAGTLSKVLNGLMITAIAILQFSVFRGTGIREILVMVFLIAAAMIAGWMSTRSGREESISVSIITAMRNMSLSMGIAMASFAGTLVVTTVLAYSFLAGSGLLLFSLFLGRRQEETGKKQTVK